MTTDRQLRLAFNAVMTRLNYTGEELKYLWQVAKSDKEKAYRCYRAILRSYERGTH